MFTGIEVPFALAFLYPALNYWWFPKIKPDIEKEIKHESQEMEGVEIYDYHSVYHPPTYVNVNNIMVPIGGHTAKERKALLSKHISKDKQTVYFNYWQVDNDIDINKSFAKEAHINNYSALERTFKYYNIPVDNFAINLPLKVNYFNYKNGCYFHNVGGVATDKDLLIKKTLWSKRLPLTITVPIITGVCVGACWFHYAFSYGPYYPPFHPKRIKGYFKK
jgi:hypothetical protein